ncbi:MAG: autotransporter-associated beta strand repeat-containing protein [Proteobacteria bacterium]|nr:autotransporter-associated beta strand repeat-containing protein [Pseudomonadota bacterium]
MRSVKMARTARVAVACLLGATALTPLDAVAQTWVGTTSDYTLASNWNPASVPGFSSTATFSGTTASAIVDISNNQNVGAFVFDSDAKAYTVNVTGALFFRGTGITNNSAQVQTLTSSTSGSNISFFNSAGAGNARFEITDGGNLFFNGSSTAANATVVATGDVDIAASHTASLGNATITLSGSSAYITLWDTSRGDQARLTLNSGSRLVVTTTANTDMGSIAGSGIVSFNSAVQLAVGGNGESTTFSGSIAGGGSILKTGAGTWTLSGSNSYSGGTTINAGTISISANNGLGSASGGLTFGGGTLQTTATFTMLRSTTLNAGGGTFEVANGTTLTQSGLITGAGDLTKSGGGTLILSGNNDYTGDTNVNAGTLALSGSGSIASSAVIFLGGSGTVFDISLTAGGATVSSIADAPLTGSVIALGSKTLTITGIGDYYGNIQDGGLGGGTGGGITLASGAVLILSGVNTYTGATTINENAVLELDDSSAISSSSIVNLAGNGAVFDISCGCLNQQMINDLQGVAGSTVRLGDNSLIVGTANSTTFDGVIDAFLGLSGTGTGGLIKQGTGTLTLTGTNTYTGGTAIIGGLINFTTLDNFGTGNVTLSGGGVQWATGNTIDISPRLEAIGINGGTFDTNGNDVTLATAISGLGGITKAGSGTLTFTAVNTYAGLTTVNGGTLALSGSGSVASSSGVDLAAAGATFDIAGSTGNQTIQDLSGVAGSIVALGNRTLTAGTANSTTFSGVIADNGLGGVLGGSFIKAGSGTLTLEGENSYTGATTIGAGTLALANGGQISESAVVTVASGATFDIGNNVFVSSIRTLAGAGTVQLGANMLRITHASTEFSGTIDDGGNVGGILIEGGTLTLSGVSTFGGPAAISGGGTLALKGAGSIANTGVGFYGGPGIATFDISQTTAGASLLVLVGLPGAGGVVALGSKELTITLGTFFFSFDGSIQDGGIAGGTGGRLRIASGAIQILSGVNTYTGATTIEGDAALILEGNGSIATSSSLNLTGANAFFDIGCSCISSVTVQNLSGVDSSYILLGANTLTVASSVDTTFAGVIEPFGDTGGLTKTGSATLTLTGTNLYAGATTIAGGTLALAGTGSIAASSGVALAAAGVTFDISASSGGQTIQDLSGVAGTFIVLGGNTLTVGTANSTTFSGSISGSGGLTKQGSGTLTLESMSGFDGTTTIAGGTLALVGSGIISYSSVMVASGATFDVSGTSAPASLIRSLDGSGTVQLGSIELVMDNAAGSFSGTIVDAGPGVTRGALTIIEGSLTLSGVSTYGGVTQIYQGATLALTGAGSIADTLYVAFSPSFAGGVATFDISGTTDGATVGGLRGSSGSGLSVVLGNQTLTITGTTGGFTGVISGSGGLVLAANAAQGLAGDNSYTGATMVGAGATLVLYDNGSVATSSGVNLAGAGASLDLSGASGGRTIQDLAGVAGSKISLGSNSLTVGTANDTTFAGVIADGGQEGGYEGSLVKQGSGTLILTGANTYTGGTTVLGGTLQGTTTSLQGNIVSNATVTFNQSTDGTYFGAMSGSGRLTLTGSGNVTLVGANTYSGGTVVSDGTLTGTTTSLQGDIVNNARVVFDQATDGTYAGVMSGDGVLTKTGFGTLILTANNTYSGGTIISGGILQLGNGGTTGMIAGDVFNEGTLAFNRSDDIVFAGNISGSGDIAYMGPGTVTLTGTNTYSGGTAITGGTVQAGSDSAFGAAGTRLTLINGTLQATASFTIARPITLSAPGGTFDTNGNQLTLQGAISGSGALTKTGAGTLILDGVNTYRGGTTVSGGILQGTTSSLQRNIVNNASVVFSQSTDGTYGGNMSGTGGLTKSGSGNVTLTGSNSYTGGTTVSGGTLTGTTTSLQGNILNNAAVVFSQGTDGTYAGVMSGTGGLTKSGTGNLTLTGANSYGGGTTVSGGTLTGNTTSLQGNILNNAAVVFSQSTDGTYAGSMSGTGGFTKSGAGNLTLTGANSYTGGTTVSGGTLTGNSASLQGNVVNNAAVVFNQGTDGTYAGNMSGTGGFTKNGAGNLTLTGTNSYSGGTVVSGGTLTGNSASLQGNIANNAALVFDQASGGTYAGAITGSGSLTKAGAGQLILTGNNVVGGGTTVSAGLLTVNGSLTSNVVVGTGGMIGGNGTIVGRFASNGGIVAPGNSIGTLTVTGNFSQTGGVYQVEVNSGGQNDKIVATGTATIGGGATVQVLAASGTYARNTTYTIVTATGGLTGTYSGVTSNLAFLTPSLSYDANNVYLLLAQTTSAFASGAQTRNQYAVGTALDIASPTATGDFNTVLNALAGLDTQQGPAALNTISGQPYTGFGTMNVGASLVFMNALGQQVAQARNGGLGTTRVALAEACTVACDTADLPKWGAWISGLGGFGSVGGNTNAGTLSYNLGGAAVGVDYRLDPRFLVGLAVGYSSGRQWVNGFMGNGNADTYSAALYASFNQGGLYVDALAGYAYSDNRMQRAMAIPGLATRIASGQTGANQFLGQIEAGYRIGLLEAAQATITPFARFQTVAVSQNPFTESGAQSLNLGVAQQNTTSVRTIIGADLGANIPVGMERPLGVTIRLGWAHEYADTSRPITAAFAGAPAVAFTVYGAQPLRDAAVVGLGLNAQIGASTSIYARYDGEITGRDDTHAISAGLRMTW